MKKQAKKSKKKLKNWRINFHTIILKKHPYQQGCFFYWYAFKTYLTLCQKKIKMKKILFAFFTIIILSTGCGDEKQQPTTAIDTGRDFIRASLNGDFKNAQEFLLQDDANKQFFESYKSYYGRLPAQDKEKYKAASYEINKLLEMNDSTVIINYSNSYMHQPMEIKVIKKNNKWAVDFTYTSSGNLPIN